LEALLILLETTPEWSGSASELHVALARVARERGWRVEQRRNWPQDASLLGRCLMQIDDSLREAGFVHTFDRDRNARRHCFAPVSNGGGEAASLRVTKGWRRFPYNRLRCQRPTSPQANGHGFRDGSPLASHVPSRAATSTNHVAAKVLLPVVNRVTPMTAN